MKLTLVKKQEEARGTVSFFWESDRPIVWRPGQYLYFTLDLPSDAENLGKQSHGSNVRHFTIASSPTEETIQLTTRIRDDSLYKQTLNKLEIGAIIECTGPRGDFVLDQERENPQIFLAGGIGITPFRSMIKYATDKGLKTPIRLVYSNSTPEDITFKEELDEWAQTNPDLKVSYTITKPGGVTGWEGLTGRINSLIIENLLKIENLDLKIPTWWVCGPPMFVSGMQDELQKLSISGDKVEMEQFTGY